MFQINVCKHSIYLHLGLVNCNLSRKLVEVLEIHAIIMEYNQPNPHYTLCNLSLERIVILWFSLVLFVCFFFLVLQQSFFFLVFVNTLTRLERGGKWIEISISRALPHFSSRVGYVSFIFSRFGI